MEGVFEPYRGFKATNRFFWVNHIAVESVFCFLRKRGFQMCMVQLKILTLSEKGGLVGSYGMLYKIFAI